VHFQRIALNRVGNSLPGLFGAVGVKLDPIAKHLVAVGDGLESQTIAHARIHCGRRHCWEHEEFPDPLGFG